MKIGYKIILVLICTAVFFAKKRALIAYFHAVRQPNQVHFVFDYRFAKDVKQEIEQYFNLHLNQIHNPHDVYAVLADVFPIIKKISVISNTQGHWTITIIPVTPLVGINEAFVLTCNRSVVMRKQFGASVCNQVPSINVADFDQSVPLSDECIDFALAYHKKPADWCLVEWHNPEVIYLHDKEFEKAHVLTDKETAINFSLYAYQQIKQDLLAKELPKKRFEKKSEWMVDVRFKNQIIVFQKGEKG